MIQDYYAETQHCLAVMPEANVMRYLEEVEQGAEKEGEAEKENCFLDDGSHG